MEPSLVPDPVGVAPEVREGGSGDEAADAAGAFTLLPLLLLTVPRLKGMALDMLRLLEPRLPLVKALCRKILSSSVLPELARKENAELNQLLLPEDRLLLLLLLEDDAVVPSPLSRGVDKRWSLGWNILCRCRCGCWSEWSFSGRQYLLSVT